MGFNAKNSYILGLMTIAFIIGEIAHFLIGVLTEPMGKEIGYGDYTCYLTSNESVVTNQTKETCKSFTSKEECENAIDPISKDHFCEYLTNGQGSEYYILAGTAFVIVFTVSGIIMGILSDIFSRPKLLAFGVVLFSISGSLMGVATEYWHLVVLRMAIGAGESVCRPASSSVIAELFDPSSRGVANGIFSWGVYIGYGLTFTLGNYMGPADILGYGWRSAFIAGCAPGVIIAVFLFFVPDPRDRKVVTAVEENKTVTESSETPTKEPEKYWRVLWKAFIQPAMIFLFLAAAVRHTGGFTWSFNTQIYLKRFYPDYNPGLWLTMCSIFGGSFGVFFGGLLSDFVVKKVGLHSRLWILSVSTFIAAPLAVGVLSVEPPYAFIFLLAYYFFAETWFSILFTVLVEIVPPEVRSACIAIFLFLMNNVGQNLPGIVDPVADAYDLRTALYIFWPGSILTSAVLFFVASIPLWKNHKKLNAISPNK